MDECMEYLLGVAQKIIKSCAEAQTQEKYFGIKDQLIRKGTLTSQRSQRLQHSRLSRTSLKTLPSQVNSTTPRKSALAQSVFSVTSGTQPRHSSRGKTVTRDMGKGRVRSKSHRIKTDIVSDDEAKRVLTHIASILANAQQCPTLLSTITFNPNTFTVPTNTLLTTIANSLSGICQSLLAPEPTQQVSVSVASAAPQNHDQLIQDNRWLIARLQKILEQNATLRRMVGRSVVF